MTREFKFEKGDMVLGKNLPLEVIDMGFRNNYQYQVYGASITTSEYIFYLKLNSKMLKLQNADGKLTGLGSFFEVIKK